MRDEVVAMHAWEIAEGEAIAEEGVVRIVACCAAAKAGMAEEALATYVRGGTHGLGFVRQVAYQQGPCLSTCLGACQCLVDVDASDLVGVACVAEPSARGPCCSEAEIVAGMTEA